jgi:hypothetical protein
MVITCVSLKLWFFLIGHLSRHFPKSSPTTILDLTLTVLLGPPLSFLPRPSHRSIPRSSGIPLPTDPRSTSFTANTVSTSPDQLPVVLWLNKYPFPRDISPSGERSLILILQMQGMHEASVPLLSKRGPDLAPLLSTIGGRFHVFRIRYCNKLYNMRETGPPPCLLAHLRTVPYDRGGLLVFGGPLGTRIVVP